MLHTSKSSCTTHGLEDAVVPVEVVTLLEKCICYDASKRPTVIDMLQAFDLPR